MTAVKISLIGLLVFLPPLSALPFDTFGNPAVKIRHDSRSCLSCHDGTMASNIVSQDLRVVWGKFQGQTPNNFCLERGHPIGIDYRLARLRSRGKLKDPSQFDPAVKLENGRVGCTSCHDPNSQIPKRLVMSNRDSRLCFSCHNL